MPTRTFIGLYLQHLEVLEGPDLERVADVRKQTLANLDRLLVCVGARHIMDDFPYIIRAFEDLKYREHIGASSIIQRLFATGLDDLRRLPTRWDRHKICGAHVLRGVEDFRQLKLITH